MQFSPVTCVSYSRTDICQVDTLRERARIVLTQIHIVPCFSNIGLNILTSGEERQKVEINQQSSCISHTRVINSPTERYDNDIF